MQIKGMNSSLDQQNKEVLARYLQEAAGKPEGHDNDLWESAEKQLQQNLFDETGPISWITPAQIQERMKHRIAEREKH
jgi:hypothetical protein